MSIVLLNSPIAIKDLEKNRLFIFIIERIPNAVKNIVKEFEQNETFTPFYFDIDKWNVSEYTNAIQPNNWIS